jgi:hypothetical protein
MEVIIKKNLRTLDADNNFTYVIEVTHNGKLVNKSQVKVCADEYAQPMEDCCGGLTKSAIDGILDQLTFEFQDFDPLTVPITSEIIAQ